ncbi:MAG: carboxypeptidase-like regulatory domain-containing protein, partial [Acidobacteria bacterium]|nr:carboxypeptidase-like regulatory domain-containing protein [Acidobacteriota bacterium]
MSRSVLAVYLSPKSASFILAVAIAMVFGASATVAQDRGTITGTVTDPSGGAVPGATVVARNPATGLSQSAVTSNEGTYSFLNLPAGTYAVTAEKAGFKKAEGTEIRVSVNTTVRIDMTLQMGEISEVVNVQAEAPLLQTEKTDL